MAPAIELIPRGECLASNAYLAHSVRGWQRAHAPEAEEDQGAWLAEVADAGEPDPALRFATSLILYLPGMRFEQAAEAIGPALARMMESFGARTLTFLHAFRTARWTTQRRSPPVLAQAADAFRAMGAANGFDGGIRVEASAASAVLAPLMWSVRMDMGYGQVFIVPDRGPFVLSLCQYGSLHVDVYDAGAVSEIRDAARAAGLAEWDGHCGDLGLDDGAIEGRALWLDASPDGDGED